jgi:5-methylcytosine-specific restriction endonuclease McrA
MRREFTRVIKRAALARADGACELCGLPLCPGKYRYDHRLPDALGGEPILENCVVQCLACDKPKTAEDIGRIRKADRVRDRATGALTSRRPMPCGKNSPYKRTMSGKVVPR